jgi:hypothetical protein
MFPTITWSGDVMFQGIGIVVGATVMLVLALELGVSSLYVTQQYIETKAFLREYVELSMFADMLVKISSTGKTQKGLAKVDWNKRRVLANHIEETVKASSFEGISLGRSKVCQLKIVSLNARSHKYLKDGKDAKASTNSRCMAIERVIEHNGKTALLYVKACRERCG